MRYILCQPENERFKWELTVALTNYQKIGIRMKNVILLFAGSNNNFANYFAEKYGVNVYQFEDNRKDKSYVPSIKPYLWYRFLKANPQMQKETYFYVDSDVIFRRPLDFRKLHSRSNKWLCSDCNGYLNLSYIRNCKNGNQLLSEMTQIVGVTVKSLETINNNSGGAQWIINQPAVEYWHKVYLDSNKLWHYFGKVDSDIQAWTAEMWAQLWNMIYFNIGPEIKPELEFCWATDPIERWQETKIMHNAGVTKEMHDLFFKGKYLNQSPFEDDLNFVNSKKVSIKYVQAIKEAIKHG